MTKAQDAAMKIFEIIDEKSEIDSRSTEGEIKIASGTITIKAVNFVYPSRSERVLRRINFEIPARKKIALVGHSGCGKSTIVNLLLRMYDVTGGQVLIDGVDIKDYNIAALRKQIGYVMQEPILFNMTIKENILYGNPEASDIRVR
jgi:ABC-type multidrug transport system fused ATPase/permease subunit